MTGITKTPNGFKDLTSIYTVEDVSGSFWDSHELDALNKTLILTTIKLRDTHRELTDIEQKKVKLEVEYQKKYRRALVESVAKTESLKRIEAELECEELEYKIKYLDTYSKELKRAIETLKIELDTLKNLGHNVRTEMKIY